MFCGMDHAKVVPLDAILRNTGFEVATLARSDICCILHPYKRAFLGLFGVCLIWVAAPLNIKKASKRISSKDPFLTELRPVQVLYKFCTSFLQVIYKFCTSFVQVLYKFCTSEFPNIKLAIFSWFLRHPQTIHFWLSYGQCKFCTSFVQVLYKFWTSFVQVLYKFCTSELSNTKLAIFSWFLRHPQKIYF